MTGELETLELGAARIVCLPEMVTQWPRTALFGKVEREVFRAAVDAGAPGTLDADTILLSFNIYLVELPQAVVLIDAGIGQGKTRPDRPAWHMRESAFPQMLAAAGVGFDQLDIVLNTHLHADHVGWNTMADPATGDWLPAFPNARYLAPATELEDMQRRRASLADEGEGEDSLIHGAFSDSLRPIFDGPGFEAVQPGDEIAPGLRLVSLAGHTPGQVGALLDVGDVQVLFCADAIHHPAQLGDPSIGSDFCTDPWTARQTRTALLDRTADAGMILAPYHFPAPSFGRVVRGAHGFEYRPLVTK